MSIFLPSFSTCSVPQLSADEFFSLARDVGYEYFETFTFWTGVKLRKDEWPPERVHDFEEKYGVKLATLNVTNLSASKPEELDQNIEAIAHDLEYAKSLGLSAGTLKGAGRDQPMEVFAAGAAKLADVCADLGMYVRLGNHPGNRLMTTKDYRDLFSITGDVNELKVLADTRHFDYMGQDMVEFINEWHKKIDLIHINDHIDGKSLPLGEGKIDVDAVLDAAFNNGYRGFLTVEIEVDDTENMLKYAADACKLINKKNSDLGG